MPASQTKAKKPQTSAMQHLALCHLEPACLIRKPKHRSDSICQFMRIFRLFGGVLQNHKTGQKRKMKKNLKGRKVSLNQSTNRFTGE
jgi:hypothetical protein